MRPYDNMVRASFLLSATIVVAGCPKSAPEPGPTPPAAGEVTDPPATSEPEATTPAPGGDGSADDQAKADGADCVDAGDCLSGICEGLGCGEDPPGKCASKERMCTRDFVEYCGCDDKTFGGSGSCPGKRYKAKGSCPGDPGPLSK